MNRLLLIDIAREITPLPSILAARLVGKHVWERLRLLLLQGEGVIEISLAGVEIMDASFADEVFGTLAAYRARKEATFALFFITDANEICIENLKMALETRADREPQSQERLRNCVVPLLQSNDIILIGKFEDHVLQSLELLGKHKTLTARDLADLLNLNLNAASTRLKTLADLGLAYRVEVRDAQGKQFIYRTLT